MEIPTRVYNFEVSDRSFSFVIDPSCLGNLSSNSSLEMRREKNS